MNSKHSTNWAFAALSDEWAHAMRRLSKRKYKTESVLAWREYCSHSICTKRLVGCPIECLAWCLAEFEDKPSIKRMKLQGGFREKLQRNLRTLERNYPGAQSMEFPKSRPGLPNFEKPSRHHYLFEHVRTLWAINTFRHTDSYRSSSQSISTIWQMCL